MAVDFFSAAAFGIAAAEADGAETAGSALLGTSLAVAANETAAGAAAFGFGARFEAVRSESVRFESVRFALSGKPLWLAMLLPVLSARSLVMAAAAAAANPLSETLAGCVPAAMVCGGASGAGGVETPIFP